MFRLFRRQTYLTKIIYYKYLKINFKQYEKKFMMNDYEDMNELWG